MSNSNNEYNDKKQTVGLLIATQVEAIDTREIKTYEENKVISAEWRLWDQADESIARIVSECPVFRQKDKVAAILQLISLCAVSTQDVGDHGFLKFPVICSSY